MKIKIIMVCLVSIAFLLMMPSIPAIQQKSIEEGFKQDLRENLYSISLDDSKEIEGLEGPNYSLLYDFVMRILDFRFRQFDNIENFLFYCYEEKFEWLLIFGMFRLSWVTITIHYWNNFWYYISNTFGWDWGMEPYPSY